jgi:hypothetical protein
MGSLVAFLAIAIGTLAALAWAKFDRRRADREIADAARESEERSMRRAAEIEAAFQQQLADVFAQAEYFCRYSAHEQGLLLLDETAVQHPMAQRPASPPPDPGEPWQLNIPNFPPEAP